MVNTSTMTCPGCEQPLQMVGDPGKRVFNCESCGGLAVVLSVLRKIAPDELVNELWRHTRATTDPGRRCPSCSQSMALVGMGYGNSLELDVCRVCQIVWFDLGELAVFSPLPKPDEQNWQMPQNARILLAQAKLDQIRREVTRNRDLDVRTGNYDRGTNTVRGLWDILLDVFRGLD